VGIGRRRSSPRDRQREAHEGSVDVWIHDHEMQTSDYDAPRKRSAVGKPSVCPSFCCLVCR
jgi:hypothetical protein